MLECLIANTEGGGDIRVREILELLGERAFGLAILVFTLPNSLPIPSPPGFSAVTGIPILLLAAQMVLGRLTPWLPRRIGDYSFSREKFATLLKKALPYIRRIERLLHPRLAFMHGALAERMVGLVIVFLALVLSLPIPFGNFVPGLSMSLIAIGMLERDGALMLAGILLGVGGVALIFTALGTAAYAAFEIFLKWIW